MGWSEWYERKTAVTASVSAQGFGVLLLLSVIALNFNTEVLQRDDREMQWGQRLLRCLLRQPLLKCLVRGWAF